MFIVFFFLSMNLLLSPLIDSRVRAPEAPCDAGQYAAIPSGCLREGELEKHTEGEG
jgi:hypothetical protein